MADTWTAEVAEMWAQARQWEFADYYKYRFTFTTTADGVTGRASAGGDSTEIYRWNIGPVMSWEAIREGGDVQLTITGADGGVFYETPYEK